MNFFRTWRKALNPFSFEYDSKNWNFSDMTQRIETFLRWLIELNFFLHESKNWTFFCNMTQRNEPSFATWLEQLNLLFYITQLIEPSFWKTTIQRIELLFIRLKELNLFWIWRKELNLFFANMTQRIELFLFFSNMTQRIDLFKKHDLKNWTSRKKWLMELNLSSWIWRKELNFFLRCGKELNLFFFHMTQRIHLFIRLKNCFFYEQI